MGGRPGFELEVVELETGDVLERDGYRIAPVAVSHRGPALGYVLFEDERPGRVRPRGGAAAGLTPAPSSGASSAARRPRCRPGRCWARPARAQARALGRHNPHRGAQLAASGADVLVHEATFAEEERSGRAENGHSTAAQAAGLVAGDAGVWLSGP